MSSVETLNKDYMDIDEFLASQNFCGNTDSPTLAEPDSSGDFDGITDPIDFVLSADQLHEYTTSQIDVDDQLKAIDSPISSDEGQGKSICSETGSSECSSETNVNTSQGVAKKRGNTKKSKSIGCSSDARTSTWKVSSNSEDINCLATAVEIEGVSYTYNLVPTAKGRKPSRKSVPGNLKDQKYWDRRSKNNEAAKRSRDLRRRKEMLVASRAADLEIENEELKAEVTFLKERVKMLNRKLQEKKYLS